MRRRDVAMRAGFGMMRPRAKEPLKPREAARGKEQNLPENLGCEHGPVHTLISNFRPPDLQNKFLLFKEFCGNVLKQPRETNFCLIKSSQQILNWQYTFNPRYTCTHSAFCVSPRRVIILLPVLIIIIVSYNK